MWKVLTKGAGRLDAWKEVFRGDERAAHERYARELAALRAGHVALINPAGRPVRSWWAGRGRPLALVRA